MTTNPSYTAYKVYEIGCGEPDTVHGYFQTKQKAESEKLRLETGRGFCKHGGFDIDEIIIEP